MTGSETWLVAGVDARHRLMSNVAQYAWEVQNSTHFDMPPTPQQIVMVLRALADHTALQQVTSRFMVGDVSMEQAMGRYLHALADYVIRPPAHPSEG